MNIDTIKPISETFSLEEAFQLMHSPVIPKNLKTGEFSLDNIGVIQGVLDIENEVEILIRFIDGIKKFDKQNFSKELEIYVQGG